MQLSSLFALQHATLPSFCHGPMANSQLVFIWKHNKQPIPDRLPQCIPALAKARLYKMTRPDPSMNRPPAWSTFYGSWTGQALSFYSGKDVFLLISAVCLGAPRELGLSKYSPPLGWAPPLCTIKWQAYKPFTKKHSPRKRFIIISVLNVPKRKHHVNK